jgi:hypothetical protein
MSDDLIVFALKNTFLDLAKRGHDPMAINGAAMGMCRKSMEDLMGKKEAIELDYEARKSMGWTS